MTYRIAFIIDQLRLGGTEKQLVELVRRIDRSRFEPFVYALRDFDKSLARNVDCEFINLNITKLISFSLLKKVLSLRMSLKKNKIQIVQTYFPESTFIGSFAGRLAGVPLIVSTRRDMGAWHSRFNRSIIKLSNLFVDKILVNSDSVKQYVIDVEKVEKNRVHVIYNGIDADIYELNHEYYAKNDFTIGVISNFNRPVKRFDVFVNAMNTLAQKNINFKFLIVGDVNIELMNSIPDDLKQRYEFTGNIEDVTPALRRMDVGVLCSDSEGFSNVILEYMASSVPCVCTKSGGNIEIIEDGKNGYLFKAGNSSELQNKILNLYENVQLRTNMARTAREVVEKYYGWDNIIKQHEDYYNTLVAWRQLNA